MKNLANHNNYDLDACELDVVNALAKIWKI